MSLGPHRRRIGAAGAALLVLVSAGPIVAAEFGFGEASSPTGRRDDPSVARFADRTPLSREFSEARFPAEPAAGYVRYESPETCDEDLFPGDGLDADRSIGFGIGGSEGPASSYASELEPLEDDPDSGLPLPADPYGEDTAPWWGSDSGGHPYAGLDPYCEEMTWQFLPPGLMFKAYLAGEKETRLSTAWLDDKSRGRVWETTLGGRVGLIRYGTPGAIRPNGWQIDLEGAALARIDPEQHSDLEATDYRFGIPWTWRQGPLEFKLGYYHISSHVGDEFLLNNPGFTRLNYVRDSAVAAVGYYVCPDVRVYAEAACAPAANVAEPWEFQFGGEYSPARAVKRGDPFFAVNAHLREEFDYGGSINVVTGWQWRSPTTDRLLRVGLQYYNGKALQYSFFDKHETLIGGGLWIDY